VVREGSRKSTKEKRKPKPKAIQGEKFKNATEKKNRLLHRSEREGTPRRKGGAASLSRGGEGSEVWKGGKIGAEEVSMIPGGKKRRGVVTVGETTVRGHKGNAMGDLGMRRLQWRRAMCLHGREKKLRSVGKKRYSILRRGSSTA